MIIWRKVKGSTEEQAPTGSASKPPQGPLWTTESTSWMTSHPVRQTWPPEDRGQDSKVTSLSPLPCTAAAAKSLQSCLTLCNPIDCSPPGSRIPGILQARTLKWVAISFSSAWKWKVTVKSLSHVWLPATPWTAAYQAPLSVGFSRQEYWSGVPLPSPLPCTVVLKTEMNVIDGK